MADNAPARRQVRRRLVQNLGTRLDFDIIDWYWDNEAAGGPDATRSLAPVAAALGVAPECMISLWWTTRGTADLDRLQDLAEARGFWQLNGVERDRARWRVIVDFLIEQGT
jgi:hypothetical protein